MSVKQTKAPSQPKAAKVTSGARLTLLAIAGVSGVVNLLALTTPLFMLQVYDRVLSSRSGATLLGLAILAAGLFGFQALLDILRGRTLLRIGDAFDGRFSGKVFEGILRLPLETRAGGDGIQPLRDLDNIRSFLSGQGPSALMDLPWLPIYLAICFLFHPWLGFTALAGAVILTALTLITNILTQGSVRRSLELGGIRNARMEAARRNAEVVRAMGLEERLAVRWQKANSAWLTANRRAGDVSGGFGGAIRGLRVLMQSAILAVGALLVIRQEVTPGVMIAASIMMGRALAPIDLAVANWRSMLTARQSWSQLKALFALLPERDRSTELPPASKEIRADGLAVVPPGESRPTIAGVNLVVPAGSALGIIGPSGSGKSTLVRALVGAWKPAAGKVRIDGASLEHWDREALGRQIGYLPQGVELFEGTIAENIARFDPDATDEAIVAAAKVAGAHELILRFEHGYATRLGEAGSSLSAGQRQRIGLARALYGDPFLVVLDEPNANLDAEGEAAVVAAIAAVRKRAGVAIVVAHRPSAIGVVDLVMMMEGGQVRAFGPRDEVLARVLKAHPGTRPNEAGGSAQATKPTSRPLGPFAVVPREGDPSPPAMAGPGKGTSPQGGDPRPETAREE